MKKFLSFGFIFAAALIASCGGSDGTILNPGAGTVSSEVTIIELTVSSPTLNSSATGETTVTILAVVKDAGNAVLQGIPVAFQTDSGSIAGTQPTTDITGTAIAELNTGADPSNRTITVTATAGTVSSIITVQVIGTTLSISGPPALALADTADYTISLQDSQGAGIQGTVTVSSASGNTLSETSVLTSTTGQATVTVTADNSGVDTLTATALGLTDTATITVSGDIFSIQTPVQDQELNLNTNVLVTVLWSQSGAPQVGELITFTSTRGSFPGGNTAMTNGSGQATVQVNSTSAGPATITAINSDSTSTSVGIEFVATMAATLDVQANPLTIGINRESTISATVRDANGNPVKNQIIVFVIEQDATGNSFLSIGSDVTDSQGRASTVYTAGGLPSAANGVLISATVQGTPAVTDTVPLTVAGTAIDMAIGTGAELFLPTTSLYAKEWAIIVTDTSGTAPEPLANTNVQASLRSVEYHKGQLLLLADSAGDFDWVKAVDAGSIGPPVVLPTLGPTEICADEDTNQDGFLDLATEDLNTNGTMEAGNRATVTAVPPGAADDFCGTIGGGLPTTTVLTDGAGIARVCVVYVRSDNLWVNVRLTALLTVVGTEFSESQDFILDALAADLEDETTLPAGRLSPFGQASVCTDPN